MIALLALTLSIGDRWVSERTFELTFNDESGSIADTNRIESTVVDNRDLFKLSRKRSLKETKIGSDVVPAPKETTPDLYELSFSKTELISSRRDPGDVVDAAIDKIEMALVADRPLTGLTIVPQAPEPNRQPLKVEYQIPGSDGFLFNGTATIKLPSRLIEKLQLTSLNAPVPNGERVKVQVTQTLVEFRPKQRSSLGPSR